MFPGEEWDVEGKNITIGSGLLLEGNHIVSMNSGILRTDKDKTCFWVDYPQKRVFLFCFI